MEAVIRMLDARREIRQVSLPRPGGACPSLSRDLQSQRAEPGTGPEQCLEGRKAHSSSYRKVHVTDRIQKAEKSSFWELMVWKINTDTNSVC